MVLEYREISVFSHHASVSVTVSALCPKWLVYAALLSVKRHHYELIIC